jgi:hypothetical protein
MSEDVVKQLREIRWRADLMHEAADCIERLEANYIEACDEAAECYMRQCITERKLTKAVEALRACVASIEHADMSDGVCCCGEEMDGHSDPMNCGHTPTDMGKYYAFLALKAARKVLAELEKE